MSKAGKISLRSLLNIDEAGKLGVISRRFTLKSCASDDELRLFKAADVIMPWSSTKVTGEFWAEKTPGGSEKGVTQLLLL